MRPTNRPPGISDINLLNGLIGLSCFCCLGLWLFVLLQLSPYMLILALTEQFPIVKLLMGLFLLYPKSCLAAMLAGLVLVGMGLRLYLRRFSLRSGWPLPLFHLLVSLVFSLFIVSLIGGLG